jgi:hypothetical protein
LSLFAGARVHLFAPTPVRPKSFFESLAATRRAGSLGAHFFRWLRGAKVGLFAPSFREALGTDAILARLLF